MKRVSLSGGRFLFTALLAVATASTDAAADDQASLPRADIWSDYRAIIWHPQKTGSCAALKELGIDAGAVIPEDRERPGANIEQRIAPLLECGLTLYVENVATDFYSAYHRYSPDKPVNWRFVEIKSAYQTNPK